MINNSAQPDSALRLGDINSVGPLTFVLDGDVLDSERPVISVGPSVANHKAVVLNVSEAPDGEEVEIT